MTLRSPSKLTLLLRDVCIFAVLLLLTDGFMDRSSAQGLSGTPQRLEETLGRSEPPASGAGPASTSGQPVTGSRPPSSRSGSPSGDDMEMGMDDMEMGMDDMEMGMDDEYGGYGSGGSRSRSGGPQSDAMQTYASSLISVIGGLDLSPLFAPAQGVTVEGGPYLQRESEEAFKAGNQAVALELMFGHMATEYKDASAALRSVKYSKLLRRPVWGVRWGISMSVRSDAGTSDPSPIREGATPLRQNFAAGGRGGRQGSGDDYDSEMMEDMGEEEEMMEEMDDEMEMDMEMEMGGGSRGRGTGRAPSRRSAPAIPVREMLSASTAETFDKTLGLVAKVAGEEFTKRYQNGDFGPALTTVSAPAPVAAPRGGAGRLTAAPAGASMSAALNDALMQAEEPLPMWKPGIVYLGQGTSDEIIPAARAANLDVVLHFDVILKGRNEAVQNISRCRLLHIASEKANKSVISSRGMDSFEAAKLASAGRSGERDYVADQFEALFAYIDREIKVMDLPRLQPAVARTRIAKLINSPNAHSLRTLAEIRLFQAQGLIDQSEVEAAFDIIGGVDALMLMHGPLNERIEMARSWSVASQGSDR